MVGRTWLSNGAGDPSKFQWLGDDVTLLFTLNYALAGPPSPGVDCADSLSSGHLWVSSTLPTQTRNTKRGCLKKQPAIVTPDSNETQVAPSAAALYSGVSDFPPRSGVIEFSHLVIELVNFISKWWDTGALPRECSHNPSRLPAHRGEQRSFLGLGKRGDLIQE